MSRQREQHVQSPCGRKGADWSAEHEGGQWRVRLGRQLGLPGLGAALEPLKGFSGEPGTHMWDPPAEYRVDGKGRNEHGGLRGGRLQTSK